MQASDTRMARSSDQRRSRKAASIAAYAFGSRQTGLSLVRRKCLFYEKAMTKLSTGPPAAALERVVCRALVALEALLAAHRRSAVAAAKLESRCSLATVCEVRYALRPQCVDGSAAGRPAENPGTQ